MNPARPAEIPVVFYRTSGGAEPVLDWLRSLAADDRRAIGTDLATVQFGWPVGMALCRPLGQGLWEVRSALSSRRIALAERPSGAGRDLAPCASAPAALGALPRSPHRFRRANRRPKA